MELWAAATESGLQKLQMHVHHLVAILTSSSWRLMALYRYG